MKEIWKDVVGFEGLYKVSNKGRVKSLQKIVIRKNGVAVHYKEKMLNPSMDECGYYHFRLSKGCEYKLFKAHRLVAKHFLPDYNDELTVNHIDHNKYNNKVTNLEMMTLLENITEEIPVKKNYYCKELKEWIGQPKRWFKKHNMEYDKYRLLQSIRLGRVYLNTGLHFEYKVNKGDKK